MELRDMRKHIDQIDKELLSLFEERMQVSKQVALYKSEHGEPVFCAEREQEILAKIRDESGKLGDYAVNFFQKLMDISKEYQINVIKEQRDEMKKILPCGLIGERLGHSFSKIIHEQLYCRTYDLVEADRMEIHKILDKEIYQGLNVTMPYKKEVLAYCSECSDEVNEIGSANTLVKLPSGGYKGYNTDVNGFCYMAEYAQIDFTNAKVLILGNGGACAAVKYAAEKMGALEVNVISRRGPVTYQNLSRYYDADILVNATPVGMFPDMESQIVDLTLFKNCRGVMDLIYNPSRTRLLLQAEKLNINYTNGLPMLVAQALYAEELFFRETFDKKQIGRLVKKIAKQQSNLVLVGMPGSGKSVIGCAAGRILGRRVVDLDDEIESKYGMTIPDIFEKYGEAKFREMETKALRDLKGEKGIVLVTGGGTVLSDINKELLRYQGVVCHIERSVEKLARKNRPLSEGVRLEEMYKERIGHYKACRDVVIGNRSTLEEAARLICREFDRRFQ